MATQVFKTRRGRITLTDETLTYAPRREPQQQVTLARTAITEIRSVARSFWNAPPGVDVMVYYQGGMLTIPRVGARTANALRTALGF